MKSTKKSFKGEKSYLSATGIVLLFVAVGAGAIYSVDTLVNKQRSLENGEYAVLSDVLPAEGFLRFYDLSVDFDSYCSWTETRADCLRINGRRNVDTPSLPFRLRVEGRSYGLVVGMGDSLLGYGKRTPFSLEDEFCKGLVTKLEDVCTTLALGNSSSYVIFQSSMPGYGYNAREVYAFTERNWGPTVLFYSFVWNDQSVEGARSFMERVELIELDSAVDQIVLETEED